MPATPVTTEAHAIAERLRAFSNMEGNVAYLEKISGDAAGIEALVGELAAVVPPVDPTITDGLTEALAVCRSAAAASGNVGLWPLVGTAADQIDTAASAVEAASAAKTEGEAKPG